MSLETTFYLDMWRVSNLAQNNSRESPEFLKKTNMSSRQKQEFLEMTILCALSCTDGLNRYRNPYIEYHRQINCAGMQCPADIPVCEVFCLFLPCPRLPTCVADQPNVPRPGWCPPPWFILGRRNEIHCYRDTGCISPNICCHSFQSSYCFPRNSFDANAVGRKK